jgi:hypothetical protein
VMLTLASTLACATRQLAPEPLVLDRVECARCKMLISTEHGSGEIVSATEDTRFYDDLGCLAADWDAHRRASRAFVRVAAGQWTDAESTSFARLTAAHTAMDSGVAAFATPSEARAVDRDGRVLTFDDVVRLAGARR